MVISLVSCSHPFCKLIFFLRFCATINFFNIDQQEYFFSVLISLSELYNYEKHNERGEITMRKADELDFPPRKSPLKTFLFD